MTERKKVNGNSLHNPRLNGEYWRIAEEREDEKCVFCDLREKYIVAEEDEWVLTVNIFPYIDGQLLVIPRRHVQNYSELSDEDVLVAHRLISLGARLLRERLGVGDVWLILRDGESAGKTVKHLHWNVMPYEEGLNTWHYQELAIPPVELARRLREENG